MENTQNAENQQNENTKNAENQQNENTKNAENQQKNNKEIPWKLPLLIFLLAIGAFAAWQKGWFERTSNQPATVTTTEPADTATTNLPVTADTSSSTAPVATIAPDTVTANTPQASVAPIVVPFDGKRFATVANYIAKNGHDSVLHYTDSAGNSSVFHLIPKAGMITVTGTPIADTTQRFSYMLTSKCVTMTAPKAGDSLIMASSIASVIELRKKQHGGILH